MNVEFVLSKDRKLRAIIFNKNSLDISGATFGRRNRQGISFSYRQDFERFFSKASNQQSPISSKPTTSLSKDVEFIRKDP